MLVGVIVRVAVGSCNYSLMTGDSDREVAYRWVDACDALAEGR